jgi:hypothetical protein
MTAKPFTTPLNLPAAPAMQIMETFEGERANRAIGKPPRSGPISHELPFPPAAIAMLRFDALALQYGGWSRLGGIPSSRLTGLARD